MVTRAKSPKVELLPEVETRNEKIDPQLATYMLENMIANRRVNKARVTAYTEDMLSGGWVNNGETIKMSPDGKLVDGQHRLYAVIASGCTIEFTVAYNVPLDMVPTIDAGRPRSINDYLTMTGGENSIAITAAVRMIVQYEDRIAGKTARAVRGGMTNLTVLHELEKRPDLGDYVAQAMRVGKQCQLAQSVVCAAIYLTRGSQRWMDFWSGVESGAGLSIHDPRRHVLRIGLGQNRRRSNARLHQLGLIIKAWNAYVSDREIQTLVLKESEQFPRVVN